MKTSMGRNIFLGNLMVGFLVFGIGLWASLVDIAGAVIAPGVLVVDTNVKKIQHPTGGVIATILAHDGDEVKAGDVLLRLDPTIARASLAILDKNYNELYARKTRLEAERDNLTDLVFPKEIETTPDAKGEADLFLTRRTATHGQKEQLEQEITSLQEQVASRTSELSFIMKELDGVRELYQKGYSTIVRLNGLERERTRTEAEIADAKGKISETRLQVLQVDKTFQTEVEKDLRETEARLGEVIEKRVQAKDQVEHIEIKAPRAGIIDQSTVHTIGGVINPSETLMLIIPPDSLVVEAKIAPKDISEVKFGQTAFLRFTNFNQRTTPEVEGVVRRISPDTTTDKNGATYYIVRISVSVFQQRRLGDVRLIPGMPVEVFIKTEERKVLSYLVKPLMDQIYHAFRER